MDKENLNLEVNRRKANDPTFKRFRFLNFSKKTLVPPSLVINLKISGNLSKQDRKPQLRGLYSSIIQ